MSTNGIARKGPTRFASCLFVLLVLLSVSSTGAETKSAYTRDGINFVSKERMEENIRYEYAKPGDYREVQVPLKTMIVNASVIPQIITNDIAEKEPDEETGPSNSSQNAAASVPENRGKYPYASIGIGLLIAGGVIVLAASGIRGRGGQ